MFDVTTLGEVMLRLTVPPGVRLEAASQLDLMPGGAEANVAALLARLGRRTAFASALPDNPLGRLAANHLRTAGVDLGAVDWRTEGRMGLYFVEFSAPPRPIEVIYDRSDSCLAHWQPAHVAWPHLLDSRLIHLTGITPALSPGARAIVTEARALAHAAGLKVSFDINYRQKLWDPPTAAAALRGLAAGVDLLFCGQADAARVFACSGRPEEVVRRLADELQAKTVVLTLGDSGVMAWDGSRIHRADALPVQVIDRLGAGDALAAGVMHGWLDGDLAHGLRCGVALAALALSQFGDMVITTPAELDRLLTTAGAALAR